MLNNNKLTLLHSIRGFAAFYVVIFHAKFLLWSGGKEYLEAYPRNNWDLLDYLFFAMDMLSSNGTAMVIVFFVLSGFFIAYSFNKNNWGLKEFFINRAIRIYVPYLSSILFAIIVLIFLGYFIPSAYQGAGKSEFLTRLKDCYDLISMESFLAALLFMKYKNEYIGFNFPYWSLLYEGIFYLIAPWVVRKPKLYLIISACLLTVSALVPNQENPLIKFGLEFSFYFALGIWLFEFSKNRGRYEKLKPAYFIWFLILIFLLIIFIGVAGYKQISFVLAGLFACVIIYFFLFYEINENIGIRIFKKLGVISFSLYLFHLPVLVLTFGIFNYLSGQYIFYSRIYWIGVLVATVLSFPIYYLVENKSLRLISKLKKKGSINRTPVIN